MHKIYARNKIFEQIYFCRFKDFWFSNVYVCFYVTKTYIDPLTQSCYFFLIFQLTKYKLLVLIFHCLSPDLAFSKVNASQMLYECWMQYCISYCSIKTRKILHKLFINYQKYTFYSIYFMKWKCKKIIQLSETRWSFELSIQKT